MEEGNETIVGNHNSSWTRSYPCQGTVVPNRIFVGGFDVQTTVRDLHQVFSKYGAVRDVNIVMDHSGNSRGYGFVTFMNQEDAMRVIKDPNGIFLKDTKVILSQAVRKRPPSVQTTNFRLTNQGSATSRPLPQNPDQPTTSTGSTHHDNNSVGYVTPPTQYWPQTYPGVLPQYHQPVYQQPAYDQYQYVPIYQYQQDVTQSQVPSRPFMYYQQSDHVCQPTGGGFVMDSTQESLINLMPNNCGCTLQMGYHYVLEATHVNQNPEPHSETASESVSEPLS